MDAIANLRKGAHHALEAAEKWDVPKNFWPNSAVFAILARAMEKIFIDIADSADVSELWAHVRHAVEHFRADKFSYHFTPIFASQVSEDTQIMARGFSLDWIDLYESAEFRKCDPIPDAVMRAGHTISWDEALEQVEDRSAVDTFVSALQEHGLTNGFGVPLFGPENRDAYASFGFPEGTNPDEAQIVALTLVGRAAHDRVCQLVSIEDGDITLSRREKQVLQLIAAGKSNSVIAQLLEISADTVATYVKRIYTKLGVNDRVGATVKALKLTLITL